MNKRLLIEIWRLVPLRYDAESQPFAQTDTLSNQPVRRSQIHSAGLILLRFKMFRSKVTNMGIKLYICPHFSRSMFCAKSLLQ